MVENESLCIGDQSTYAGLVVILRDPVIGKAEKIMGLYRETLTYNDSRTITISTASPNF